MSGLPDPGTLLLLVLAGGLGAVGRVWISERFARATLTVNVAGSLAAGCVLGWSLVHPGQALATVLAIGLLGSFTTFSTWMVEVIDAAQGSGAEGEAALRSAVRRAVLPVGLGILAAVVGITTGVVLGEGLVARAGALSM